MTTADHRIVARANYNNYLHVARIADRLMGGPGPVDQATYGAMIGDVVDDIWTLMVLIAVAEQAAMNRALRAAALVEASEREQVRAALHELALSTGDSAYEHAMNDIDAGATWEELGGGWVSVQRAYRPAHIAHRESCDCLGGRHFCRHRALAHAVAFAARVEDAEAAPLAA